MSQGSVDFRSPPIQEVSYSIQFKEKEDFHIGFLGLLWDVFRAEFPNLQHAQRISHEVERFGVSVAKPMFQLLDHREAPCIWMVSPKEERLLQIQNDMFVLNWRKYHNPVLEYPRFEVLIDEYKALLNQFTDFLQKNGLGGLEIDQVQVTNVNHILETDNQAGEIFEGLNCGVGISDDLCLENYSFKMNHVLNRDSNPIGRLHTTAQRVRVKQDGEEVPAFRLTFVARSNVKKSQGADLGTALDTIAFLRNNINMAFKKLTNSKMHQHWEIKE